jgi:hypothetical protein
MTISVGSAGVVALVLAGGAAAQSAETWECQAFTGWEWADGRPILVVAKHDEKNVGTVSVAGTVQTAVYSVQGFDRRWDFGPRIGTKRVAYSFVMQPNGHASYFDFSMADDKGRASPRQQFVCKETSRSAASAAVPAPAEPVTARLDQYIRAIQDKIERSWTRPLSANPGIDCMVSVTQLPTGDVIEARVAACNGDDAVVQSIEAAVRLASPLPRPSDPSLFERNLNVRFRPGL